MYAGTGETGTNKHGSEYLAKQAIAAAAAFKTAYESTPEGKDIGISMG